MNNEQRKKMIHDIVETVRTEKMNNEQRKKMIRDAVFKVRTERMCKIKQNTWGLILDSETNRYEIINKFNCACPIGALIICHPTFVVKETEIEIAAKILKCDVGWVSSFIWGFDGHNYTVGYLYPFNIGRELAIELGFIRESKEAI